MKPVNYGRITLGALAGTILWVIWGLVIHYTILAPLYTDALQAGYFLKEPRYPFFQVAWVLLTFVLSWIGGWFYTGMRTTLGAGPKTALLVGALLGFFAGFPLSFSLAAWLPAPRVFPLGWLLELWGGSILAVFASGWIYKDPVSRPG